MFRDHYNIPLVHVDASNEFLGALAGEADPETKRKTIGRLFIETFEAEAKKIGGAQFLAQGTLYPDVIESVSFTGGPSVTIKSHHNVGGLPARMNMQLVEPLRELFKDEVRALGRELGLPEKFVGRHPFPGPGLAIRLPGGVSPEKLDILRRADAIYLDEIRKAGLYDKIWQAFAVLLPVQTVGVMGDGRTYEFVCALRAVTSVDGMTARFLPLRHGLHRPGRHPHHQRSPRHQPGGLRRDEQAAGHNRVGVRWFGSCELEEARGPGRPMVGRDVTVGRNSKNNRAGKPLSRYFLPSKSEQHDGIMRPSLDHRGPKTTESAQSRHRSIEPIGGSR